MSHGLQEEERSMLGISLREHVQNEVIWECNEVNLVIAEYRKHRLCWARHATRPVDNRWLHVFAEWYSRDWKFLLGKLPVQQKENLIKQFGFVQMAKKKKWQSELNWKHILASGVEQCLIVWPLLWFYKSKEINISYWNFVSTWQQNIQCNKENQT